MKKTTLDTILSTVEGGFAAVASDIADIKSTMATKDDVRAIVHEELRPIWSELNLYGVTWTTSRKKWRTSSASARRSTTRLSASRRLKNISASTRKSPPDRHRLLRRHWPKRTPAALAGSHAPVQSHSATANENRIVRYQSLSGLCLSRSVRLAATSQHKKEAPTGGESWPRQTHAGRFYSHCPRTLVCRPLRFPWRCPNSRFA